MVRVVYSYNCILYKYCMNINKNSTTSSILLVVLRETVQVLYKYDMYCIWRLYYSNIPVLAVGVSQN